MGTRYTLTITALGKPLTGGSGGGGPNDATWAEPEQPHVFGMNSMVAYGANVQIACPLNFQMALGSNVQVCINPSSFLELYGDGSAPMSPLFDQILGGGAGGNMQLTMGTSANVVMGQSFDINLGPKRIAIDVHNKAGIQACCPAIGTLLWVTAVLALVAYGIQFQSKRHGDDQRSITLMTYQLTTQILITLLMNMQKLYDKMDSDFRDALDTLYGWDINDCTTQRGFKQTLTVHGNGWVGALILIVAMLGPIVMEVLGEVDLSTPRAPQPGDVGDVVDDSGAVIGHEHGE